MRFQPLGSWCVGCQDLPVQDAIREQHVHMETHMLTRSREWFCWHHVVTGYTAALTSH